MFLPVIVKCSYYQLILTISENIVMGARRNIVGSETSSRSSCQAQSKCLLLSRMNILSIVEVLVDIVIAIKQVLC